MEMIKLNSRLGERRPENFTGVVDWDNEERWWYKNGKVHREDGPAIKHLHNGDVEWCLHGEYYNSKGDWFNALTDNQKEDALWSEDLWK